MLVVGLDAIFVSHLPMFHAPHDFQLLAEVELEDAEPYRQDRKTSAEPIYTIDPEPFSWKELLPDGSEPPRRTSFKADVYRGHFERGGTQIIEQARVKVRSVDFSTELLSSDPASEDLTYRGLGQGDELFMAHEIRGAPNFDHVLSFRFVDPAFAETPREPQERRRIPPPLVPGQRIQSVLLTRERMGLRVMPATAAVIAVRVAMTFGAGLWAGPLLDFAQRASIFFPS